MAASSETYRTARGESGEGRPAILNTKPLFKLMVEQGLRPVLHGELADQDQDRGADLPDQQADPDARDRAPGGLRADDAGAARVLQPRVRDRLRDQRAGPRPLPRQRLPPARLSRDGAALHHRQHAEARPARPAGDHPRPRDAQARPGADGRRHRLGQVDHARGDDRPPQRDGPPITSSRSRIRSSSCTPTSARSSTSARSASTPSPTTARCARDARRART
jgi:hypothetical protein